MWISSKWFLFQKISASRIFLRFSKLQYFAAGKTRSSEFDNFEILSTKFQASIFVSNSKVACGFSGATFGIEITNPLEDGEFFHPCLRPERNILYQSCIPTYIQFFFEPCLYLHCNVYCLWQKEILRYYNLGCFVHIVIVTCSLGYCLEQICKWITELLPSILSRYCC